MPRDNFELRMAEQLNRINAGLCTRQAALRRDSKLPTQSRWLPLLQNVVIGTECDAYYRFLTLLCNRRLPSNENI